VKYGKRVSRLSLPAKRRSGADEVISALPHGYDTILGKRFEDEEELSMGE
jgi:ATP-binding cassette subfamily B protein